MAAGDSGGRAGGADVRSARTGVRPVALALLVVTAAVLAGCSALSGEELTDVGGQTDAGARDGPGATGGDGGSTSSAPDRLTSKLSAPPETIFRRVEDLVGAEADSYPEVEIGATEADNVASPFFDLVVGPPANASALREADPAEFDGNTVTIDETYLTEHDGAVVERQLVIFTLSTLARDHGWFSFPDRPHDYAIYNQGITYVVNAYAEQYRSGVAFDRRPYEETTATDYEWASRDAMAYYAYQWVTSQVQSPDEVTGLMAGDGPPSSEQFLSDTDDEPMALGMDLETSSRWFRSPEQAFRTRGPVTIRAVLRTQLDRETAAGAAEGWGQDRYALVASNAASRPGLVWAHRWDSEADADEFAAAMETYLEERRNESDGLRFEFRRPAPDATVLVAGPPAFMNATTVAYDTGNVTVSVGTD